MSLVDIEDCDMAMEVGTSSDMTKRTSNDDVQDLDRLMSELLISNIQVRKFRQGQVLTGRSVKRQLPVRPPVLDPKSRAIKKQAGKWSPARNRKLSIISFIKSFVRQGLVRENDRLVYGGGFATTSGVPVETQQVTRGFVKAMVGKGERQAGQPDCTTVRCVNWLQE